MILEENKQYNLQEISAWFDITRETFRKNKQKKLEELKLYADYELVESKKGYFRYIEVHKVYCDTYYKQEGHKMRQWLESGDRWDETADHGVSSATIVTNYYCKLNNLPYDGQHYEWVEVIGKTENGKETVKQNKRKPSDQFKLWHYLYRIVKNFYALKNNREDDYRYDLSTDEWNPTRARLSTEEDKKLRDEISAKYYGNGFFEDAQELVDFISEADEEEIKRSKLQEFIFVSKLSNKERRMNIAYEQKEAGVLKRDGIKRMRQ